MDTVTQMLLGATVAQAGFRSRLGRRSLPVGALLGLLPDLDVVAGWIGGPFTGWLHHRGLTHSIFFGPIAGVLIGWLIWRWHKHRYDRGDCSSENPLSGAGALRAWIWLSILALVTHPIIDLFTSYGTQLLYPASDTRFAVNAMPIIDSIYSLALLCAVIVGACASEGRRLCPRAAQDIAGAALIFTAAYTLGGWAINERVERLARAEFSAPVVVNAYPTLFQPLLRRVVVETEDEVLVGFHSVLGDAPITWQRYPRETSPAIDAVAETREAEIFEWFAMQNVIWQSERFDDGRTVVRGLDHRYGMPGASALALWGIEAHVDSALEIERPIEIFRVPRDASGPAWADLWSRILGRGGLN